MKIGEIAARLGCTVHGDTELDITGVAGLEYANPDQITFLANPKYAPRVKHTRAGAILVTEPVETQITSLISANPYLDFARTLEMFYQPPAPARGIHPLA